MSEGKSVEWQRPLKYMGVFVAATLVSTLAFLPGRFGVQAADAAKPVRGEPIKPLKPAAGPPRGEPIKPLSPAASAGVPTNGVTAAAGTNAPAGAPTGQPESVTKEGRQYSVVGFDRLSAFKYEVPDETNADPSAQQKADDQIPKAVKDYSGKPVALKGFMLPLKVEGGLVTELLIMRDQSMCCFGSVPKINEWVSVRMTTKGVKPIMDQAVTLYGKLKVGGIRENGYLVGIYAMDGETIDGPSGL